jgi:hypothetical protein
MMKSQTIRNISLAFLLILCGIALFSNVQLFFSVWKSWNLSAINQDPSTLWENRIEAVRDDLPEEGELGYISEMDIPGMAYNAIDTNEEYVLTQYYLAPRLLIRGKNYPYVIGNLADLNVESTTQLEELTGLEFVASYGNGIYLFRGTQP